MPSLSGNKIIFDATDYLATLHPQYSNSTNDLPPIIGTNKLTASQAFDPYRFSGYAAPGVEAVGADNADEIGGLLIAAIVGTEGSDDYGYALELEDAVGGTKLHRINLDLSTFEVENSSPWPHTISGSGIITGGDLVKYDANVSGTGQKCAFYSYVDAGGSWDVGRYTFSGTVGGFDDDFMTTVPTTTLSASGNDKAHPMIVGNDDKLYIGDGRYLHAYDGSVGNDGTVSNEVLVLPPGYNIRAFALRPNFLAIFADVETERNEYRGKARCFFWNYLDEDPSYIYDLNDNFVTAATEINGTILCWTTGRQQMLDDGYRDRTTRIQEFVGDRFDTVQVLNGYGSPIYRGVDVVGQTALFNVNGDIYQYGSPVEGAPIGLNKVAKGSGSQSGFCRRLYQFQGVNISTGDGDPNGLEKLENNYAISANFSTVAEQPVFPNGQRGRVKSVTVYYGATASGGRELALYLGTETGVTTLFTGKKTITADNIVEKYEVDSTGDELPAFSVLKCIGVWSEGDGSTDAPIIQRVVVEFELENITS